MNLRAEFRAVFRFGVCSGALLAAFSGCFAAAQAHVSVVQRPRITGISHVAYYTSDLPATLAFWHDFLGFEEYFSTKTPGSDATQVAFLKINDRQHVELVNEPHPDPLNFMGNLCFAVDDVEQMRAYLQTHGVSVKAPVSKTPDGDLVFEVRDPDGTRIEFVQTLPGGVEAKAAGRFMPATRIATQIYHVGFLVGNAEKSLDFYGRILGFQETWRGGRDPNEVSWINMRVPDGTDYVEFMLYSKLPEKYGSSNHTSLEVPDIAAATAMLQARPAAKSYGKPMEMHLGVNRKRQLNLFDPDGTRVELMEPNTIDGKPTPSSTGLVPHSEP